MAQIYRNVIDATDVAKLQTLTDNMGKCIVTVLAEEGIIPKLAHYAGIEIVKPGIEGKGRAYIFSLDNLIVTTLSAVTIPLGSFVHIPIHQPYVITSGTGVSIKISTDCLVGYSLVREIHDKIMLLESHDTKETIVVKKMVIDNKNTLDRIMNEVRVSIMMGKEGIGPRILDVRLCGKQMQQVSNNPEYVLMFMQKLDNTVLRLWSYINNERRNELVEKINAKIKRMHDLDFGHGDLHDNNVMYKYDNGKFDVYIIDYEYAYRISTGKTDPKMLKWMKEGWDWKGTYEEFVNIDYTAWLDNIKPLVYAEEVTFAFPGIDECKLISALHEKLGWKTYIHNGKYVLLSPGDEFILDANGFRHNNVKPTPANLSCSPDSDIDKIAETIYLQISKLKWSEDS